MIRNLPGECWLPIDGYESLYAISNRARIKSLRRIIFFEKKCNGATHTIRKVISEKLKEITINQDGYPSVTLSKDGKSEFICVHLLLARAFIPNPGNLPIVHHKDNNKKHCSINNLEWVSVQFNTMQAQKDGCNPQCIKILCTDTGKIFHSARECDRYYGWYLGKTSKLIKNPNNAFHLKRVTE